MGQGEGLNGRPIKNIDDCEIKFEYELNKSEMYGTRSQHVPLKLVGTTIPQDTTDKSAAGCLKIFSIDTSKRLKTMVTGKPNQS
ncbi:hypothetical protein SDJN02_10430, partial [Cucurbita argyrosperma subsp. argyrosperma]